jgi:sulfur-oxidizing protein SoxB
MIAAQKLLGVDLMTAHWEFTYGQDRVKDIVGKELGKIEFLA